MYKQNEANQVRILNILDGEGADDPGLKGLVHTQTKVLADFKEENTRQHKNMFGRIEDLEQQ